MEEQIIFNSQTEILTYPDGITETLEQYNDRKYRFEYIQSLQNALERMKILYQNPGCLTEKEYLDAKRRIQEEFDFWEANIFLEFDDK
jgi:hypothetical protein